jgi:hypothetical protein
VPGIYTGLAARWTVRRAADGRTVRGFTNAYQAVPEEGYPPLIRAHGRAVALLSEDIATAIISLQRTDLADLEDFHGH